MIKLFQLLNAVWTGIRIWQYVKPPIEPVVEDHRTAAEKRFHEGRERMRKAEEKRARRKGK